MNNLPLCRAPMVSVVMSVYNNRFFLTESIDSIINQSFNNFEFIIINDGSMDDISSIVKEYSDPRIKFFDFKQNEGTIKRLNYGFSVAKGKYITIMDSDDISSPNRLQLEVDFLENNLDYGMCSAFFDIIDQYGNIINHITSEITNDRIKIELMFRCKIAQDTVMIRRELLESASLKYDIRYPHTEDYKMWYEVSKVTKMAVIPEVLLQYRSHSAQVSSVFKEIQKERSLEVIKEQINALGINPSNEEMEIHTILARPYLLKIFEPDYLTEVEAWIQKIKEGNFKSQEYNPLILNEYLSEVYERVRESWESLKPNRFCNLCNSNFKEFYFISPEFILQWDAYQYIHSIFALETFNLLEYECPNCGANDMERLIFLFLEEKINTPGIKVLNLSSSSIIHNYFKARSRYFSLEYKEEDWSSILSGDRNTESWIEENDSVDVLLCINTLQQVKDDVKAIRELYRILKPGGYGIVMAPIQLTLNQVYKNDNVTKDAERWKHFGHSSYRRLYSKEDFITGLEREGFEVESFGINHFDPVSFEKYGIHPRSVLYVVKKN